MTIRLYNTMGRKLQPFRPARGGTARVYCCGPTVWDYSHVGNFRTFVFDDLLRRYLLFKGFKVVQVMNITDVEDRIIQGMKASGLSLAEHTTIYEKAFMEDLASLNVQRAEHYPRATEHIPEIVSLIKGLEKKGYAYRGEDGSTYFDISKFRRYGRLSGIDPRELKAGARISQDHYEKQDARDFALWKAWVPADGDVFWETSLGKGRPGWHVECSAMSMKYLGPSFDLHTGAKDLRFPHHENEIAQSEAATGKRFVRFWLHGEFLSVSSQEMHKSAGNTVKLRELTSRGWDPLSVRYFLISAHYREPIDLNDSALASARAGRQRIQDLVARLSGRLPKGASPRSGAMSRRLIREFARAMDNDLGTPAALAAVFSFVKEANALADAGGLGDRDGKVLLSALSKVDSVLGVLEPQTQAGLSAGLLAMISARDAARRSRNFDEADRIRKELLDQGIVLEDTPAGTVWKRRHPG